MPVQFDRQHQQVARRSGQFHGGVGGGPGQEIAAAIPHVVQRDLPVRKIQVHIEERQDFGADQPIRRPVVVALPGKRRHRHQFRREFVVAKFQSAQQHPVRPDRAAGADNRGGAARVGRQVQAGGALFGEHGAFRSGIEDQGGRLVGDPCGYDHLAVAQIPWAEPPAVPACRPLPARPCRACPSRRRRQAAAASTADATDAGCDAPGSVVRRRWVSGAGALGTFMEASVLEFAADIIAAAVSLLSINRSKMAAGSASLRAPGRPGLQPCLSDRNRSYPAPLAARCRR